MDFVICIPYILKFIHAEMLLQGATCFRCPSRKKKSCNLHLHKPYIRQNEFILLFGLFQPLLALLITWLSSVKNMESQHSVIPFGCINTLPLLAYTFHAGRPSGKPQGQNTCLSVLENTCRIGSLLT